jgi:hypothetical protein
VTPTIELLYIDGCPSRLYSMPDGLRGTSAEEGALDALTRSAGERS